MTDYPEVALIEAFKDGMLLSLKQMIMVTPGPPATLKNGRIGSTPRSEQKTNDYETSLKQGREDTYIR